MYPGEDPTPQFDYETDEELSSSDWFSNWEEVNSDEHAKSYSQTIWLPSKDESDSDSSSNKDEVSSEEEGDIRFFSSFSKPVKQEPGVEMV